MAARCAAYVNEAETVACGEWHGDDWPGCDHVDHLAGRELLKDLGFAPRRVGPDDDVQPAEAPRA
jgi:hypothetical protein